MYDHRLTHIVHVTILY